MADTRERIISAANEVFRMRGYHGTSIKRVAQTSGATVGSMYHFFPGGKDELTIAVIESTGQAYGDLVELIMRAAPNAGAAMSNTFDGAAAVILETDFIDPCPIGGIAREIASTNEPLRMAAERAMRSWIHTMERVLIDGGVPTTAASDIAQTIVATIEGAFMLSRTLKSVEPLHSAGRQLHLLVAAAIEPSPIRPGR